MDYSKVILIDEKDFEIGSMDKLEAHRKGLLHRALSVFIINSKGQWLLQQRAIDKYHSGGLWTNTCCSHPAAGELTLDAASRRLKEEMGIQCTLEHIFHFIYKDELQNQLIEHELDHVYIGFSDEIPEINMAEVMSYLFLDFKTIDMDVKENPEKYTTWFRRIYLKVQEKVQFSQGLFHL